MDAAKRYWFPAKRYGWGWSLPIRWQGWLVMACYVAGAVALSVFYPSSWVFFPGLCGLSVLLVLTCWLKGEPPRWRWGK